MSGRIKGTHGRDGTVTITFNSQADRLDAPETADGKPRKYLPCDGCGAVLPVAMNVVSFLCQSCPTEEEIAEHEERMEGNQEPGTYFIYRISSQHDGGAVIDFETNDDDDDGVPGEVTTWRLPYKALEQALRQAGKCRTGLYGQPVTVELDGVRVE